MTPEQTNQIIFIALLSIPSLIVLGGVVYVSIIVMPTVLRQMQQLMDNNKQLTNIAQQNADQVKTTEASLASITPELVKQTNSIDKQTNKIEDTNLEIKGQRVDLKNYNTLVIDTVSNHAAHMEANTVMMAKFEAAMVKFDMTMNGLPEQIRIMISDQIQCDDVLRSFNSLENYVKQIIFQQQRKTGTHPIVPISTETPRPSTP